jgi:hypothetical protein
MQIPPPVEDFPYYDGLKIMHADRLAVFRQLLIRTRGKPNELANKVFAVAPDCQDIDKLTESWDAAEQLVLLVRDLFRMQPFDPATGQGARDEHCWAVWDAFVDAMSESKKNGAAPPTSSPPSAAPATAPAGTSTSASP